MWSEHLKGWLAAAWNKEKEEAAVGEEKTEGNRDGGKYTEPTDASNWDRVVDLVQTLFREGLMVERMKGGGGRNGESEEGKNGGSDERRQG